MTFAIRYSPGLRWLFTLLGLGPRWSGVELDVDRLRVRMGWGFRGTIPVTSIVRASRFDGRVWGWGAHGWRGRWLVNGSSHGIVVLDIDPPAPSRVMGFPVRLRQLAVSLVDREQLLAQLPLASRHDLDEH